MGWEGRASSCALNATDARPAECARVDEESGARSSRARDPRTRLGARRTADASPRAGGDNQSVSERAEG
ncbi:hypothetical protein B0H12DRAFT_387382 [Mycena haematopus]|nr:hypothetical protein B0H12DRAFT_387382 [Mycena haematopus]